MNNITRVLSFDVSSTTIGWSLLLVDKVKNNISHLNSGFIKPIKKGSVVFRLNHTKNQIKKIVTDATPDVIAIEDIIKFMKNRSRAETIITLGVYNRLTALTCFEITNKEPEFYNVNSIRHGIKLTKKAPKKEEVLDLVEKRLSFSLNKSFDKKGKIKKEMEDVADAIAVGLFCGLKILGKK